MRKLAAVLLVACAVLLAPPAPAASTDPDVPRLHREGRELVDQFGRVVIVHGLNLV